MIASGDAERRVTSALGGCVAVGRGEMIISASLATSLAVSARWKLSSRSRALMPLVPELRRLREGTRGGDRATAANTVPVAVVTAAIALPFFTPLSLLLPPCCLPCAWLTLSPPPPPLLLLLCR
jgi:hypothetical protein